MNLTKINNTAFRLEISKWGSDSRQKFLLISDAHLDNAHCDRKLLRKHLEQAVAQNARIIFNGDTFCAMQGRWDKRANQDELIEELRGNRYLDKLVDYHYEFWRPYAKNILVIGEGNHETSILRHHQTSLIDRLAERLRADNPKIETAGYISMWSIAGIRNGRAESPIKMLVYHGAGGGAFVTKGTIDANRIAASYPDADLVWIGHKHNEFLKTEPRVRWSNRGEQRIDEQVCIMTPGYKQELDFATGRGWMLERTPSPKPRGGAWLELVHNWDRMGRIEAIFTRAK